MQNKRLVDPEIAAAFYALFDKFVDLPAPVRGDWREQRRFSEMLWPKLAPQVGGDSRVKTTDFLLPVAGGADIKLRWYERETPGLGAAIVYAHGGGMISLNIDDYDGIISDYVAGTGVPFLSVDYRLAPEAPGPSLAEDVFSAIRWLIEQANEVGVDPMRIAVMGDSGGGGVAAGAAILARDHGIDLAAQLLIYPMLDDRTIMPDPSLLPTAVWNYDNNYTAWRAVLGDAFGSANVPPAIAPGRLTNFEGLPPAYIEVGDVDIFRDEALAYARSLGRAGLTTELHVHAGAPHGFDLFARHAALSQRALADRMRYIRAL
jgi:acetyl esterase/lipase